MPCAPTTRRSCCAPRWAPVTQGRADGTTPGATRRGCTRSFLSVIPVAPPSAADAEAAQDAGAAITSEPSEHTVADEVTRTERRGPTRHQSTRTADASPRAGERSGASRNTTQEHDRDDRCGATDEVADQDRSEHGARSTAVAPTDHAGAPSRRPAPAMSDLPPASRPREHRTRHRAGSRRRPGPSGHVHPIVEGEARGLRRPPPPRPPRPTTRHRRLGERIHPVVVVRGVVVVQDERAPPRLGRRPIRVFDHAVAPGALRLELGGRVLRVVDQHVDARAQFHRTGRDRERTVARLLVIAEDS